MNSVKAIGTAVMATVLPFVAATASASMTGKARGTQIVQPANPVNVPQCLVCHATVSKLHKRGAHKDVNCGACHSVQQEHLSKPSATNRPSTSFSYGSCGQCHTSQHADIMDPKYHWEWAKKYGVPPYVTSRNTEDRFSTLTQFRIPRFHSGISSDLLVNRSNGRFAYTRKTEQGRPQARLWDHIKDLHPEKGNVFEGDVMGIAWRPQKGRETTDRYRTDCLSCKTSDHMLDMALDSVKKTCGQELLPIIKKVNTSFNCNFCHDPHSAEPRVINASLIEAITNPIMKDNAYQKNAGSAAFPKAEILEMGMRGFTRKIAILDRYNGTFMCGQCHNRTINWKGYKTSDGKPLTPDTMKAAGMTQLSLTDFFRTPVDVWKWMKARGWNAGRDSVTGVETMVDPDHPHLEMVSQSRHGQAGVTCTDCHFAKKADGTLEHQPSLPKLKVRNTCMRSDCHGAGTRDNWKDEGQALYLIESIQQEYRLRTQKMEMEAANARKLLKQMKAGEIVPEEKAATALRDAYSLYLTTRGFYFADYSLGFHDWEGFESSVTKVVWGLRSAQKAVRASLKR